MEWQGLIKEFSLFTVAAGAIAWLVQRIAVRVFDRDLEKFKADLSKVAFEHQVVFQKLHEKRADVIGELYSLMVKSEWATNTYVNIYEKPGEKSRPEKAKDAWDALRELYRYFDLHRLYLPENVCSLIDKYIEALWEPTRALSLSEAIDDDSGKKWSESYLKTKNDLPPMKKAVEEEYRKIIDP